MIDPGLAEHLAAEPAVPLLALPSPTAVRPALGRKGVRGRAHADHRPAALDVFDDVPHLFVGQIAKSREQHQQIGRIERFQTRNVIRLIGIDRAVLRIDGEQHRTLEAVAPGENLTQLWQTFFGAILFVPADQHDVLTQSGSAVAGEHHAGSQRRLGKRDNHTGGQACHANDRSTVHGNLLRERVMNRGEPTQSIVARGSPQFQQFTGKADRLVLSWQSAATRGAGRRGPNRTRQAADAGDEV